MIGAEKIEDILPRVKRPARYIGSEYNSVKKDLRNISVRFALAFPDIYEVGMSHLGFKILYHLLNDTEGVACERVFSPDIDLEDILRKERLPIFTLESKEELMNFDIVGFSLAHELNYTNALNILDLAGIPPRARDRDGTIPLIIAGGPSSFNPEPMSAFIDAFVIGEAEEVITELIEAVRNFKNSGRDKRGLLKTLSGIEGIYVPEFFDRSRMKVKKRIIKDLNSSYYPVKQIVPYISIVHDRIAIEIMRGCPNGCLFCQARAIYSRRRERSIENILRLADESIIHTGYEEISLLSLSSGDHSQILDIIEALVKRYRGKGISVSLPSLRLGKRLKEFPGLISAARKSGLTFAPEAGSERLRGVINKRLDMAELEHAAEAAQNFGWNRVKLYFMIGLPTETLEDIDGMIEAINGLLDKFRRLEINVSITPFIPKPHTPFERERMQDEAELREKISYIKERVRSKRARLRFHDIRLSILEGAFSRGDRRLGDVLISAHKKGCRFDSWLEHLKFDSWMEAFKVAGIDPYQYIYRKIGPDEPLPWGHIEV